MWMGSVKDLVILKKPTTRKSGEGTFLFSDRYSVFDYGEMPDKIEGKGSALCLVSAYFFEKLKERGVKTHYLGLIEDGRVKSLDELENPVNEMKVKLYRVIKPEKRKEGYDYSKFKKGLRNYLIPLEVIYRNTLPEGSSVFRRIERGEISPEQLGLDKVPEPGEVLKKPIVDFSTKLEDEDRYLSYEEAKEISGLGERFDELRKITMIVNDFITSRTEKVGILNEDGKFEFALDADENIVLIDAVGTPDECRFSYNGFELSKEVLRKHYRRTYWYKRLRVTKGTENWRKILGSPPRLPEKLKDGVSKMYMSFTNEVTGKKFFDVPRIKEVVKEVEEFFEKQR
jgi:phosphoribosylaminoimidazole-succinocarboxamide synthase